MNILVVGASGATGQRLVEQLIIRGDNVRVIVRTPGNLPEFQKNHDHLSVIPASILDLSDAALALHVKGCDAVVSCLGHNLSLKGIYGHPRRLVTEATRRLCDAIRVNNPTLPVKFILMNTAGNSNRDLHEPLSVAQKSMMGIIRLLLPPQVDNENAAEYLRASIGQSDRTIEWAAVRPDSLTEEEDVSEYELHASPIRSAIFNPGKTSRINVAHFMARLISDDLLWSQWKGSMPVIYNMSSAGESK